MENLIIVAFGLVIASQVAIIVLLRRLTAGRGQGDRAGRGVLPLSVPKMIKSGESAVITARPQMFALRPERLFISDAGTQNGAGDWIVNDIQVCGRSQFHQSGDIPGDMFASKSIDSFVHLDMVERGLELKVVVTYIGDSKEGCAFYGAIIGAELADKQVPKERRRVLARHKKAGYGQLGRVAN
jgi:hypothetical protein